MQEDALFQEFLERIRGKDLMQLTAAILKRSESTAYSYDKQGFPEPAKAHIEAVWFVLTIVKAGYKFLREKGFSEELLQKMLTKED